MITYLRGQLVEKAPTRVVLDVQGVGYEVFIPLSSYRRLSSVPCDVQMLIREHVREDGHTLYGFSTEEERELFSLLLNINGIGPKLALSALSSLTASELKTAVAHRDLVRLSSIQGVGKKMAERIVIELKDKIGDNNLQVLADKGSVSLGPEPRLRDAVLALISLGYKQTDAHKMVRKVPVDTAKIKSVEEIVKEALTR